MNKSLKIDSPLLYSPSTPGAEPSHTKPKGPSFEIEQHFFNQGLRQIAGVDEVGRGPLAGPVVAACVILDPGNLPDGLDDSKKLTAAKRENLFEKILTSSFVSISSIPETVIDTINIRQASLLAMRQSCNNLSKEPEILLVDGRDCPPGLLCPAQSFIKGDGRSLTIAAASIIAKVVRDRQMTYAATLYPEYGFEKHKGYGTKLHLAAIERYGPCPLHRNSFSPMNRLI